MQRPVRKDSAVNDRRGREGQGGCSREAKLKHTVRSGWRDSRVITQGPRHHLKDCNGKGMSHHSRLVRDD